MVDEEEKTETRNQMSSLKSQLKCRVRRKRRKLMQEGQFAGNQLILQRYSTIQAKR